MRHEKQSWSYEKRKRSIRPVASSAEAAKRLHHAPSTKARLTLRLGISDSLTGGFREEPSEGLQNYVRANISTPHLAHGRANTFNTDCSVASARDHQSTRSQNTADRELNAWHQDWRRTLDLDWKHRVRILAKESKKRATLKRDLLFHPPGSLHESRIDILPNGNFSSLAQGLILQIARRAHPLQ